MTVDTATEKTEQAGDRARTLETVIIAAEKLALQYFSQRSELARFNKSPADFVSEADRSVESRIRDVIAGRYPNEPIVGEELGGRAGSAYWLVDPIDGTSNFLSGIPLWAISIAYVEDGHPTLGAVAIPMLKRRLIGGRDVPLREFGQHSGTAGGASLVFGIGANAFWPTRYRELIEAELKPNGLMGVSLGSCATSLALTASGEMAGYAEGNVGFWDIAAGVALCEAAKLKTSYVGDPGPNKSSVVVGPNDIQNAISALTMQSD